MTSTWTRARLLAAAKRAIAPAFYGLLTLFVIILLLNIDYDRLDGLRLNPWLLTAATAVGLVSRYWMATIWLVLLRRLGAAPYTDKPVLFHVYAKSWLGRYIPGTAPWILGKIYFASRQGLSKIKLAVSSFLEGALQILVMLTVGLALLAVDPRLDFITTWMRVGMAIGVLVCFVALWPRIFNAIMKTAYRWTRKATLSDEHLPQWRTVAVGALMFAVSTVLVGLSVHLVAQSVWPELPWTEFVFIVAVNALAGAISMLAVGAPGGIGVREAILIALLALVMPLDVAVVVTVLLRLWSIAVDFMFVGLTKSVDTVNRRIKVGDGDPGATRTLE